MKPTEETEIADKKFNRRRAVGAGLWTSCATGLVLGVGFLAFAVSGLIIIGYLLLGGAAPDDAFSFMVVPVVTAIAIISVVWIVGLSRFKFSRSTAVGAVVGLTLTVIGPVTLITTDWDIREEVNQVNGQVHRATTTFHPRNGWRQWLPNGRRKSWEFYTVDGWPEGPQTHWDENGQKYMEDNYVEGKLVSTTRWYENGQKEREEVYVNGETTRTEWHRNGVKRMESRGRNTDPWPPTETWWDPDGNVCDDGYDDQTESCYVITQAQRIKLEAHRRQRENPDLHGAMGRACRRNVLSDDDSMLLEYEYQSVIADWRYIYQEVQIGALESSELKVEGWRQDFHSRCSRMPEYWSRNRDRQPSDFRAWMAEYIVDP